MVRVEVSTLIRAEPQHVWGILADVAGQKEWMVDIRSLEITSAQKSGAGTVVEITSELFGLPLVKDVMEVTTWEPPLEFGVTHRGQFLKGTGAFNLRAIEGGGTSFSWWEDFRAPLGPMGELGHALFVRPHLKTVFSGSLNNLRLIAEGRQVDVAGNRHQRSQESPKKSRKLLLLPAVFGAAAGVLAARSLRRP